jgi:hypothetical protein
MINITTDRTTAWKAFNLLKLMPFAVKDVDKLPAKLQESIAEQNVRIHPKVTQSSNIRTITWRFSHIVMAHNKGSLDDILAQLEKALALAPAGFAAETGDYQAAFSTGKSLLGLLISLVDDIAKLFKNNKAASLISASEFQIDFKRDGTDTGEKLVGYRLYLHSRWLRTDLSDPGDDEGHNICDGLFIDNKKYSAPRARAKGTDTGLYHNLLCEAQAKLKVGQTSQMVKFEITSAAQTDWDLFVNLNSSVSLKIFIADDKAKLDSLMADASSAVLELEDGMLLAAATEVPEIEVKPLPSAEGFGTPTLLTTAITPVALSPHIVPINDEARRLIKKLSLGQISHPGLHLSSMTPEALLTIAVGIGLQPNALTALNSNALAEAILLRLIPNT